MFSSVAFRAVALASTLFVVQPLAGLAAQRVQREERATPNIKCLGGAQSWSAYRDMENGRRICYMIGAPSKSEPGAKGAKISASIAHRPAEKIIDQVSFNGGHAFKEGSDAELSVDGQKFLLFTSKETAWARDAAAGMAIVRALATGKRAAIKGVSVRGTATTEVYDLAGFGRALTEIDKACGVKH